MRNALSSSSGLIFIGNVLGNVSLENGVTDNFLEVAFSQTVADVNNLIDVLTRIRAIDTNNLVKSFVTGAGIDISLNLKEPIKRIALGAGLKPPSLPILKIGGFKNGAASGLEYIKSKIGLG